jgi:toxin ParE1/3/4
VTNFRVEIAPGAEQDIADGYAWLEAYSPSSANKWRTRIFDAIDYIKRSPLSQKANLEGNRLWHVAKTRHTIVYDVESDLITVFAVAHHRREPGYWRSNKE